MSDVREPREPSAAVPWMPGPEALSGDLDKTRALLAAVVENAAVGIVTIDERGQIQAFNPTAQAMFGYRTEEVLGRNVSLLMPSPYREEHDSYVARYLATSEARIIGRGRDVVARRKDGTIFPCHLSVGRVEFADHLWFTGFLEDVSEQRRAQETQRLLSSIVQSSDSAIVGLALNGTVLTWNRGAEDIYGYSAYEMVGQNIARIVPDDRMDEVRLIRQRIARSERVQQVETVRRRKDGRLIDVQLSVSPILGGDGAVVGSSAISRDVTDRNRMARQLLEQRSLARLGEMAAVVAHEVRNPLAAIKGALTVLQGRMPREDERAVMEEVIERVSRLSQTLDELLMFARPRPPRLEPVSVPALLAEVAGLLADDPRFAKLQIDVSPAPGDDELLVIEADRAMVAAVLTNLVVNGAQAMEGEGVVRVRASREDDTVRIEVRDNGPGIPATMRERVFEPFVTTKVKGTGLGLTVVKRVVETHGGQISLHGPPGGGTLVVVNLPLLEPQRRRRAADGPLGTDP